MPGRSLTRDVVEGLEEGLSLLGCLLAGAAWPGEPPADPQETERPEQAPCSPAMRAPAWPVAPQNSPASQGSLRTDR